MKKNNFKVRTHKKEYLVLVGIALIFVCDLMFNKGNTSTYDSYLFIMLVFAFILKFSMETTIVVTDKQIEVCKICRRKYQFNCSDIDKIEFYEYHQGRYGVRYHIVLFSNGKKVRMRSTLLGFNQMVNYLLERLEMEEIKKDAIGSAVLKSMKQYCLKSNNEITESELKQEGRVTKNSPILDDYRSKEQIQKLYERVGCYEEINCCFFTYGNMGAEILDAPTETFELCSGYLINVTEKGLAMFPLRHRNALFKSRLSNCAIIEQDYYFVPNEDIKEIRFPQTYPVEKGKLHRIYMKYDNREVLLLANIDEPKLAYHNDGLSSFINTYKQQGK